MFRLGTLFDRVRGFSLPSVSAGTVTLEVPVIKLGGERFWWPKLPPLEEPGLWLSHLTLAPYRFQYSRLAAVDADAIEALQPVLERLLADRDTRGALWPNVNGYPFTIAGHVPALLSANDAGSGSLVVNIGTVDPTTGEAEIHWDSWIASCFIDTRLKVDLRLWGDPRLGEEYPALPSTRMPGPLILVVLQEKWWEHGGALPGFNAAMECLAWAWVMRQQRRGFYG